MDEYRKTSAQSDNENCDEKAVEIRRQAYPAIAVARMDSGQGPNLD